MTKYLLTGLNFLLLIVSTSSIAQDSEWQAVTGEENLQKYMTTQITERTLSSGEISRGEYHSDGTGFIYQYGAKYPRTWTIKTDNQVCIIVDNDSLCYQLEKNTLIEGLYRTKEVTSNQWIEFRSEKKQAIATGTPDEISEKGGVATASAAEIAAELANPNTPLATLTLKYQFRSFQGNLPHADNQTSSTFLLQPSLPFPLDNGDMILFRPAIPLLLDQPSFNTVKQDFDSTFGLGDIAFDLAYARTTDSGLIFAGGIISSLPTATSNELGSKRWTLGPEVMVGKLTKKYVLGLFPNHQWDVAGSGEADISLTTIQAFGTYLPGGGWNVGSTPIITYDHIAENWTIPLNLTFGKTILIGGRPWKLSMEVNYYVEQADAFGPQWMVGVNVGPVVKNAIAGWFK